MRALAILSSIAMVVSLFLSWMKPAIFGGGLVPWDMLKQMDFSTDSLRMVAENSPPEGLVFAATFVLAALFAVLAILGLASRLLALLAGGGAIGLLVYGALTFKNQAAAAGLPMPGTGDLADMAKGMVEILGPGAYAWAGGALVLLFTGLIGFGARR